ncbi:hypothetical protein K0U07_02710, partial [bacterium]|nr:hypothetical protein [bacterium]
LAAGAGAYFKIESPNKTILAMQAVGLIALTGVAASYNWINARTAALTSIVIGFAAACGTQTSWANETKMDDRLFSFAKSIFACLGRDLGTNSAPAADDISYDDGGS